VESSPLPARPLPRQTALALRIIVFSCLGIGLRRVRLFREPASAKSGIGRTR